MANEETEKEAEKKKRPWWRTAAEIAVIVLIFFGIRAWQTRDAPDGPAPELAASTLEGSLVDVAGHSSPVLVHFWATWCGVCQAEEGNIDGIAEDHEVISIATQSGRPDQVASYMEAHGLSFPVVNDPGSDIAHRWGVRAFPTSFVVDPDGQIRHVEVGYTTSLGLRARLWMAGL